MSMNNNNPMAPMQVPGNLGGNMPGQAALDYLGNQVAKLNQTYNAYLNPHTSSDFLVAHPYLTPSLAALAGGILGTKTGGSLGALMLGGVAGMGAAGIRQSHINTIQQNYNLQSQNLMNAWSKLLPLYLAHGDANSVGDLPNNLSTIANNQFQLSRNAALRQSPYGIPQSNNSFPSVGNNSFPSNSVFPLQKASLSMGNPYPQTNLGDFNSRGLFLQNSTDINSPSAASALGAAYRQAVVDPLNSGINAAKAPANISQSFAQAAQARANALRTMVQTQTIRQNPVTDLRPIANALQTLMVTDSRGHKRAPQNNEPGYNAYNYLLNLIQKQGQL